MSDVDPTPIMEAALIRRLRHNRLLVSFGVTVERRDDGVHVSKNGIPEGVWRWECERFNYYDPQGRQPLMKLGTIQAAVAYTASRLGN